MGVKRKAPGDDKLKPDKYKCMDAKSPDAVEAKEAKTKAKMEVRPEAKARGDTIELDLEEAIEAAGSSNSNNHLERRAKGPGAPHADSKPRNTLLGILQRYDVYQRLPALHYIKD
uniref:Uncharacterized protein n=1 Tax=Romanomermis culicivorax TaxID=13658 RepID=A0A915J0M7_ROMCU